MKKQFLISIILIYSCVFASAQDFKKDITALRETFTGSYSMNINTQIISTNPNFSNLNLSGYLKVQNNLMHYKQGDEEVLHTADYMLLISHTEKNIIVDTATETYNAAPLYFLNIDTLISAYKSINFSQTKGKKQYTIIPQFGDVQSFEITIGTSGFLERVTLLLTESAGGGKAIVTYTQFTKNPNYSKDEFSPWKYVKKSGSAFIPQASYKSYTVDSAINS